MKMKNIITRLSLLAAFILVLASCADDVERPAIGPDGNIEENENGVATVFHITADGDHDLVGTVRFRLANPEAHLNMEFDGEISENRELEIFGNKGALTCRMNLGKASIPDGRYMLAVGRGDTWSRPLRMLRFKGSVAKQEEYALYAYDLEGAGTQADPYRIGNAGDFLAFVGGLMEDEFEGYGRYFAITRGFELPRRSQIIDGRVWAPVCFQGNLDGGNHTLRNLVYAGGGNADKDSGVGLFKSLFNAQVSNMKLTGALITNTVDNVGLIAGSASGNTSVASVSIEGTIQASGNAVGGLIGLARDGLTISDITINKLSVSGKDSVALLVGAFADGRLSVGSVSTPEHVFSVGGNSCVGGIVGKAANASHINVANVGIEHSVDTESTDVKIIHGDNHVGGIAGKLDGCQAVSVAGVTIKAPVSGGDYVGALIGEATSSQLSFEKNLLASVVSGNDFIGGFFGKLGLTGSGVSFGEGNRYVVKQSAEAGVTGKGCIGALAGCIEGRGKINPGHPVEIAVNIKGSDRNVGGAVGLVACDTSGGELDFDITNINFSSPTMRVEGTADGVGGVIGWSRGANIHASESFDLLKDIPHKSALKSVCGVIVKGASTVGGVIGVCDGGSVHSMACDAVVTATEATGNDYGCGGIVGYSTVGVSRCAFLGKVSAPANLGGIVGTVNDGSTIANCINYYALQGGRNLGGIVGLMRTSGNKPSLLTSCVNYGDLTDGEAVGGIAGYVRTYDPDSHQKRNLTYIEKCGNWGNINAGGTSDRGVGGIVGHFSGYFPCARYCTNYGEVSSQGVALAIGGIVGSLGMKIENESTVYECHNAGRISCDNASTKLGGVVGHFHQGKLDRGNCTLHDCVNTGSIPADQKDDTGGIVGMVTMKTDTYRTFNRGMVSHGNATIGTHNSGTIFSHDHNYYLSGTGKSWPSSTSVGSEKITDPSVYKEFDFNKVWEMSLYGPKLRNCPF